MLKLLHHNYKLFSNIKYTRNYLEDLAVDKDAIQRQQLQSLEAQKIQKIYNMPANASNPKNRIKVKTNHKVFTVNPKLDYVKNQCWILQPPVPEIFPKVTISAIRKYIITSLKKAIEALRCVKKRHVLDAINQLEASHKKVAKVMVKTLYNLIDHAIRKNLNPNRLWVHGCIIGKTKRYRHTRYHAKGRGCRGKRDFCQVRVILYEKSEKDYYEEIGIGQCAPGVATVVRNILTSNQADYETIAKFTGVTSAQGRQQARLIFKRKVDKIIFDNKQKGEYTPKKLIQRQVREQLGQKYKERFALLRNQQFSSLRLRERLYKKNMAI